MDEEVKSLSMLWSAIAQLGDFWLAFSDFAILTLSLLNFKFVAPYFVVSNVWLLCDWFREQSLFKRKRSQCHINLILCRSFLGLKRTSLLVSNLPLVFWRDLASIPWRITSRSKTTPFRFEKFDDFVTLTLWFPTLWPPALRFLTLWFWLYRVNTLLTSNSPSTLKLWLLTRDL